MSIEVEHKFLVRDDRWRAQSTGSALLRQGYLANTARCSVRVRMAGGQGWMSVKAMMLAAFAAGRLPAGACA